MTYFIDKFRSIFEVRESPHRIALAFSMGALMGNSPFLGLHYISALFFAWLFRLNKLVAAVGVTINNPWTIVPIYTFSIWVGAKVLGTKEILPEVDWQHLTVAHLFNELSPILMPFLVGSSLVSLTIAIISYPLIYYLTKKYRND